MRESLTDSHFPRRFSRPSFSEDDFREGRDTFYVPLGSECSLNNLYA